MAQVCQAPAQCLSQHRCSAGELGRLTSSAACLLASFLPFHPGFPSTFWRSWPAPLLGHRWGQQEWDEGVWLPLARKIPGCQGRCPRPSSVFGALTSVSGWIGSSCFPSPWEQLILAWMGNLFAFSPDVWLFSLPFLQRKKSWLHFLSPTPCRPLEGILLGALSWSTHACQTGIVKVLDIWQQSIMPPPPSKSSSFTKLEL